MFTAELDGLVCSFEDCDASPTRVRLDLEPDHIGVGVLCEDHAEEARRARVDSKPIRRTCGSGASGSEAPCGAAASHLVVAAFPDDRVRTLGVCPRHMV